MKTTVYHPQVNRQVKYINRKIKRYLRKYMSHHQDNWPELLMMLEYVYNTRKSDRRIFISFQIIYDETSVIIAKKNIQKIHLGKRKDEN